MKRAVVIIPTYNERGNIEKAIDTLHGVFSKIKDWDMHVLVVDDTSPDKTYEVVAEYEKKHKDVHLLINKKKSGLGGAYIAGMKKAFGELKADAVFEFDADLSHDATKIPLFLKSLDAGNDMVLGSRYIPGGSMPKDWGLHRKILSVGANILIMIVFADFKIRDWTSGFRAITKKVFDAVSPELDSSQFSGYTFQIGFLYHAQRKGFKIDPNIAYHFVDREIGQSKVGPEYIKNTLLFIFQMRIQELLRMKFFKFALVGGLGAAIQFIGLEVFRAVLPEFTVLQYITDYLTAVFLSIEVAILSNFILNNAWTFAQEKIQAAQYLPKFLQFNLASAGSILIQLIVNFIGEHAIGLFSLFTVPVAGFVVDTGHIYLAIGILLGMIWNFFAYTTFIWKKKPV